MFLLLLFFAFWGFWFKGNRVKSMMCLFLLVNGSFGILGLSDTLIERSNFLFLIGNIFLYRDISRNRFSISYRSDNIYRLVTIGYALFAVHAVITVMSGQDTLPLSFSVFKNFFSPFLLYYVVRHVCIEEMNKLLKYFAIIYAFVTVLFLAQFIGINFFSKQEFTEIDKGFSRLGIPLSIPFMFLYVLISSRNKFKSIIYILPILFGGLRGYMVSMAAAVSWIYRKYVFRLKYLVLIVPLVLVGSYLYTHYFEESYDRYNVSFAEEISSGLNLDLGSGLSQYDDFQSSGTFAFRTAMLYERAYFLLNNPVYLPFGIGSVAEESPHNNYKFILNTFDQHQRKGYVSIHTTDILWVTIMLRYGVFGLTFFFLLFFKAFKEGKGNSIMSVTLRSFLIFCLTASIGCDHFTYPNYMFMFYIAITYIKNERHIDLFHDYENCNNRI